MEKKILFHGGQINLKLNERLQTQLIHIAGVLQRAIEDGEEKLAVVLHVLQLEVLHGDGLGAVVVGDHPQGATLGDIARLGLEGPEVTIEGHVYARESGHPRRADVTEVIFTVDELAAQVADDIETLAVGRHEEHRLDIEAQRTQTAKLGETSQSDGAFDVLDFEFVVGIKGVRS